jgi:hypothetical protein
MNTSFGPLTTVIAKKMARISIFSSAVAGIVFAIFRGHEIHIESVHSLRGYVRDVIDADLIARCGHSSGESGGTDCQSC